MDGHQRVRIQPKRNRFQTSLLVLMTGILMTSYMNCAESDPTDGGDATHASGGGLETTNGPTLISQPSDLIGYTGDPIVLSVQATGREILTYQWYKDEQPLDSGGLDSIAFPALTLADSGNYFVEVQDGNGRIRSRTARLQVYSPPSSPQSPLIVTQPASITVKPGSSVTLSAFALGYPAPQYQWKKNGVELAAGRTSTLTLVNVQQVDSGHYLLVATNSAGSATSETATLIVSQSAPEAAPSPTPGPIRYFLPIKPNPCIDEITEMHFYSTCDGREVAKGQTCVWYDQCTRFDGGSSGATNNMINAGYVIVDLPGDRYSATKCSGASDEDGYACKRHTTPAYEVH